MFVEAANSKILFCRARGVFRNPHGFEQYFLIMSTSGAAVGSLSNFKNKVRMFQLVKEVSPLRQNYVYYLRPQMVINIDFSSSPWQLFDSKDETSGEI